MKRVSAYIHVFPAAIVVSGIIACIVSASLAGVGGDFTGLLLLISMATLLVGGILGFLFAIPKLNRAYDPREDYSRSTKYQPNTNLEDVSDWLTKIIIGIGLTQLTQIPGHLQNIADNILNRVDCSRMNCDFAQPALIATILYFLIAGFITGYFYTRLYLPNLFSIMEENRIKDAEIAIWRSGIKKAKTTGDTPVTDIRTTTQRFSFSDEEREVLKIIKQRGSLPLPISILKPEEQAAINVLIAKGILEWDHGNDTRVGPAPRVVDPEALNKLII